MQILFEDKDASSPMPRKLVRGQDVWLGKGQEQTRQILKCMWCGESFKSLAELTSHMQETQHYTKVISQVIYHKQRFHSVAFLDIDLVSTGATLVLEK